METISDIKALPATCHDAIIVIGNFDGVHLGHQALLTRGIEKAKAEGKPCGVLTFEPHPRRLFRPDEPPGRITPEKLKAERLKSLGLDFVVSLSFNWDLASLSCEDFIETILRQGLRAAHIVVGYNFRFGQLRKGTPDMIAQAGIPVNVIEKIELHCGGEVSSSEVRQALRQGEIERANKLLGWNWEVQGKVVKGDQRGRELGYPTANIMLGETIHPAYGIYAAFVKIHGEDTIYQSAINIGIRPMFEVPVAQLEAHILDFDRDIYGKTLSVAPVKRLRGEAKFNSLKELITQIDEDCVQARQTLKAAR